MVRSVLDIVLFLTHLRESMHLSDLIFQNFID